MTEDAGSPDGPDEGSDADDAGDRPGEDPPEESEPDTGGGSEPDEEAEREGETGPDDEGGAEPADDESGGERHPEHGDDAESPSDPGSEGGPDGDHPGDDDTDDGDGSPDGVTDADNGSETVASGTTESGPDPSAADPEEREEVTDRDSATDPGEREEEVTDRDSATDPGDAGGPGEATDPGAPVTERGSTGGIRERVVSRVSAYRTGDEATDRVLPILLGLTGLALVGRLLFLGERTAHWDEGRVAYWVLKYGQTGYFQYRPIVHGPFFFQVDKYLFALLGPSDFVARLPVAVVGGLLPLTAWLFRDRLKPAEMVALAALLAANPIMVYYSRFMRNDVLVAGFSLFALGFFVRAYDTRRARYLYAGAVSFALAFTAKENALVYLVCWLGAGGLLLDHRMMDVARSAWNVDGDRIRSVALADLSGAVAAGLFLATNPVVLAVSKRAGSDLVVVSMILVAVGSYLWLLRGANPWHYLGAAAFAGLSVAITGLSVGPVELGLNLSQFGVTAYYALCWLLAGALVLDEYLFTPPEWTTAREDHAAVAADGGYRVALPTFREQAFPPMLGAYLLFFGVIVFFYAPRSPNPQAIGFWNAVFEPTRIPAMVEHTLLSAWQELWSQWVSGAGAEFGKYRKRRLPNMFETMLTGAGVLSAFAAVGFVYDRWSGGGPRDLVAMGGYWGFVSFLGYPYATDIWAPWIAVHAIVPLAIPAAVGLAGLYYWGRDAYVREDLLTASLVAVLLVVLAAPVVVTAVDVAYLNSDNHERTMTTILGGEHEKNEYMLQWAQAGNSLKDRLGTVRRVARTNEGTDVLYYGTTIPGTTDGLFFVPDEKRCLERPPVHTPRDVCSHEHLSWHSRLPLPWYLESYGATVDSVPPGTDLDDRESIPPVVFAYDWDRRELRRDLPDRYEATTHRFKLWNENVVVFVDRTAIPE